MKGLAAVGSAAFLQQKRLGASVSESVLALGACDQSGHGPLEASACGAVSNRRDC
jgi:hypothetical protein